MNDDTQASEPNIYLSSNLVKVSQEKVKAFRAGQITQYYDQWKQLTSDPEILDIVQGAHIDLEQLPIQTTQPKPTEFCDCENKLVELEVRKLLSKGVIEPCNSERNEFISKLFLRAK